MKRLFLILMVFILITGCSKKDDIKKDVLKERNKIISNIGVTDSEKVVVKNKNNKEYHIYRIDGIRFTEYLYTFYDTKKEYEKSVANYQKLSNYNLQKYDDALATYITINSGITNEKGSLKKQIINKYKNKNNYKIIYK